MVRVDEGIFLRPCNKKFIQKQETDTYEPLCTPEYGIPRSIVHGLGVALLYAPDDRARRRVFPEIWCCATCISAPMTYSPHTVPRLNVRNHSASKTKRPIWLNWQKG